MINYKCGHLDIPYNNSNELCRQCKYKNIVEEYVNNDPINIFNRQHNLLPLVDKTPKHTKWAYTIRIDYVQKLIAEGKDYSFVNDYLDPDYWVDNQKKLFGKSDNFRNFLNS